MSFAINWLAVIVAVLASWAIGAGYYMAFAEQWLASIGKTRDQIDAKDYTPYVIGLVCQLIMAVVLAAIIPGLFGATNAGSGMLTGLLMWVGFVITSMTLNHRYAGSPWSRTIIDGGYLLIALVVQGLVIGLFG